MIVQDLYYYALMFAKELEFAPEQTSAFFSIVKMTHEHATCNIRNSYNLASSLVKFDKDYEFFKDLLLCHTINRPPYSEEIFTFKQMKKIAEYMTNTYFRHYTLYKHIFAKKLRMDFIIENFRPVELLYDEPESDYVYIIV
jgi:hypothetical protein